MFLCCPYLLLHLKIYGKYILEYFLMRMSILSAYMFMYYMGTWGQHRTKEGVGSPRAGVTEGSELLYRYWKLNPLCWRATSAVKHWVTSAPLYSFLSLFPLGFVGVESDFPESFFSEPRLMITLYTTAPVPTWTPDTFCTKWQQNHPRLSVSRRKPAFQKNNHTASCNNISWIGSRELSGTTWSHRDRAS